MSTIQKRGPGRPPRKTNSTINKRGIIDVPDNVHNLIELTHHDPSTFKCIFTTIRNLKVIDIYFKFCTDHFVIMAHDHMNNPVYVKILGEHLSSYYCAQPICIMITENNLQKLFINLSKSIDKISIEYENNCNNCFDDSVRIKLIDMNLGREKKYTIPASVDATIPESYMYIHDRIFNTNVRLSFKLSVKDCKETIADASHYGAAISIEKHGNNDMEIKFEKISTDACTETYRDDKKIGLNHNISENESFSCTVHTVTIKALTSGMMNNDIWIKCLDGNDAILHVGISESIYLYVCVHTLQ